MADITIKMRDGSEKVFPHQTRPGGSWENQVQYKENMTLIIDVYGDVIAIPNDLIEEVKVKNYMSRGW